MEFIKDSIIMKKLIVVVDKLLIKENGTGLVLTGTSVYDNLDSTTNIYNCNSFRELSMIRVASVIDFDRIINQAVEKSNHKEEYKIYLSEAITSKSCYVSKITIEREECKSTYMIAVIDSKGSRLDEVTITDNAGLRKVDIKTALYDFLRLYEQLVMMGEARLESSLSLMLMKYMMLAELTIVTGVCYSKDLEHSEELMQKIKKYRNEAFEWTETCNNYFLD